MPPPPVRSLKPNRIAFKDSFAALQYIPRFFGKIWEVSPKLFSLNVLGRLISAFIPVIMLWVGKMIIDEVILQAAAESKNLTNLWSYVGLEFGLALISNLLNRGINLSDGLLGDLYANDSSIEIIRKTSEMNLQQLEDSEFYDKLERARQQTTSRIGLMSNILSQGQDIIVVVSLITGLVVFEPWLIVLLIVSIIPSFLNELKFSGTSYSLARSWTPERRELDYLRYAGASDVTAKEVKLFGLVDYISERFKTLSDKYYELNKTLSIKRASWGAVYNVLGDLSYYGAYVLIIFRVVAGVISVGELTFLSGSFNRLRTNLQGIFTRFTRITESALYLKDYFDFLDIKNDEDETTVYTPIPSEIKKGFTFQNVAFRYPNTEKDVVRGINFELKAGEKMAFVGENGAGKTTLIKLLLRFYDPTEGQILLDGVDIKTFKKVDYQRLFGVIFQDFVKFELTIRENIAVGKIDEVKNDSLINKAAELSLANEVIGDLPKGVEQQLGRRFAQGKDLSGGQWQKIALARAYMKNAEIMILDEPTSALDARAEYEAFQRFIGLTKGKTSVIISHRFSTVRMADRIMVLKNGAVLELGTHEELLENKSLYSELFSLQAEGYK
ncbi:ATP-binding cassette, subfamily B [Spirosomataceae bacterium TFI 002]|nr:ATP-binding cassette, subfamily B [Spirosomataceae bacterium TFI 002]